MNSLSVQDLHSVRWSELINKQVCSCVKKKNIVVSNLLSALNVYHLQTSWLILKFSFLTSRCVTNRSCDEHVSCSAADIASKCISLGKISTKYSNKELQKICMLQLKVNPVFLITFIFLLATLFWYHDLLHWWILQEHRGRYEGCRFGFSEVNGCFANNFSRSTESFHGIIWHQLCIWLQMNISCLLLSSPIKVGSICNNNPFHWVQLKIYKHRYLLLWLLRTSGCLSTNLKGNDAGTPRNSKCYLSIRKGLLNYNLIFYP